MYDFVAGAPFAFKYWFFFLVGRTWNNVWRPRRAWVREWRFRWTQSTKKSTVCFVPIELVEKVIASGKKLVEIFLVALSLSSVNYSRPLLKTFLWSFSSYMKRLFHSPLVTTLIHFKLLNNTLSGSKLPQCYISKEKCE